MNNLLKGDLSDEEVSSIGIAQLLVVKRGVNAFVSADELYQEQEVLEKDTKAFMYGRVVNKKARHNLCFSDYDQKADFENKKGTVINFTQVPLLNQVRQDLPKIMQSSKIEGLQCEGNYYYKPNCYIGMHGDSEREVVVALRLGADFPLYYQWYYKSKKVGELFEVNLSHGDLYIMSSKAVGTDWKRKNVYTLRHAAGDKKNIF